MRRLDEQFERAARKDARALEDHADDTEPYPETVQISRPNRPSRMFNVRLTEEQYAELHDIAERQHLPMSTMARAWLLERLDRERRAS